MKIKFTKRSQKDKDLVTVSLNEFKDTDLGLYLDCNDWGVGSRCVLSINGIPTVFIFARPNKVGVPTVLTTRGLPRSVRMPRVGRPIYAEVTE